MDIFRRKEHVTLLFSTKIIFGSDEIVILDVLEEENNDVFPSNDVMNCLLLPEQLKIVRLSLTKSIVAFTDSTHI